jgi:hypothetical protein
MKKNNSNFKSIRLDNETSIKEEESIRWVQKIDDCLKICTKPTMQGKEKLKICKIIYNKNRYFTDFTPVNDSTNEVLKCELLVERIVTVL